MSRGDVDDVKRELQLLLSGPKFGQAIATVCADKQDGVWPELTNGSAYAVFREERLAHLVFPMCELIGHRISYPEQDLIKHAEVEIGVRWTAVAKNENAVTRYVEILVKATIDLLWGAYLPGVQSGPILVREEDYSPLVPTPDHPYLKAGIVLITVPVWRS